MSKPLPPDVVRCCVVAGDVSTPYYRAGRGEPVLLLVEDAALLAALLARFPRHVRAVAPEPVPAEAPGAPAATEFSGWLRSFLDALGLPRVAVIADLALATPVLAFALGEPDRVTRLVFLCRGRQDLPDMAGVYSDGLSAEPSLLAVWVGTREEAGIDRVVTRIVDFVGAEVSLGR